MISLFAAEERNAKRGRLGDPLQVLDRAIDFAALARAVDAKLVIGDSGRGGRPPYPTELMIRLLVVQQLCTLGLARVKAVIGLKVIAHNLMHLARLKHRGVVPA